MTLIESIIDRLAMLAEDPLSHLVTSFDPKPALPTSRKIKNACIAAGAENALGVAEVLFPECVGSAAGDVEPCLTKGLTKIRKLRAAAGKPLSGWSDTYFERLVGQHAERNGNLSEIGPNRVAEIIAKAKQWDHDYHAAFYASTTRAKDKLRKRGAPCLQYVQAELFAGDQMRLFALYRSHDFLNKALGNFIGLRRLGQFIADRIDRELAEVTVISLHPFIDNKKKAKAFANGLAGL